MPATYDQALLNLEDLVKEFLNGAVSKINEDTTRMRFVDTLLLDCLDWDRYSQVTTEIRTEVGICDYVFSLGDPLLIVEAKKVGTSFTLPVKAAARVRPLKSVLSFDKDIAEALAQVAGYALEKGAPFAAVTNGWQLVAFCTQLAPGHGWREGQALVFENLEVLKEDFKTFWNCLCTEGVRRFELRRLLSETLPSAPCPKRSDTIHNYDRNKNRNDFQADLQILGDLVFGGSLFEDRQLFHDHCYCGGGALSQFSTASRSYLADRYPDFFAATARTPTLEAAQTKKGPASALTNLTNIRKPILILGDVGVGKTTFLEHLFLVDLADQKDSLVILKIDLADKPSRPEDLPNLVASEIARSLREDYGIDIGEDKFLRGVYHGELARFHKGPEGAIADIDPQGFAKAEVAHLKKLCESFDEHMRSVFAHLVRGRNKMVVLIFDNVDQRGPVLQNATFIQAQIAASKWDVYVMLALRPETYVQNKLGGELSGYHPRAFTISPPRFDELIAKRLTTAIQMLRGELALPDLRGTTIQVHGVADYLQVLQYSFEQEPELLAFCEDISGGNMRLALDYIVAFMSCGHVNARKIMDKWGEERRYKIPLHEFVRGVMFADREYYSGRTAAIINVFDCRSGDPREAFAVLTVLSMLSAAMHEASPTTATAGYVAVEELKRKLTMAGFRYEQATWALEDRCLENRLVETNLKSGETDQATHVRISPTGSYYFEKLARTFVYVDAVCVDTSICDKSAYEQITEGAQSIPARLERADAFVLYLDHVFAAHQVLASLLPWEAIAADIRRSMALVRTSNDRAIARAQREAEVGPPSRPPHRP